jgi:hypothetical protein
MKELKEFVERENKWSAIFGSAPLDLKSAADRKQIASKLDSCLSPENLTCDGELTRAQVNAKYRFLTKAAGQLLKLDPTVKIYEFA